MYSACLIITNHHSQAYAVTGSKMIDKSMSYTFMVNVCAILSWCISSCSSFITRWWTRTSWYRVLMSEINNRPKYMGWWTRCWLGSAGNYTLSSSSVYKCVVMYSKTNVITHSTWITNYCFPVFNIIRCHRLHGCLFVFFFFSTLCERGRKCFHPDVCHYIMTKSMYSNVSL